MYTCPECEAEINQASEICPRCGADLESLARAAQAAEPAKPRSVGHLLAIWGVVLAVIGAGLYFFVWYVLPEYSATGAPKQAEAQAVEALRVVQTQLALYAAAESRFPESLEPLGAQVRAATQAALQGGYSIVYVPGAPGEDRLTKSFTLMARAGRFGLVNYYTDQTGVIHATRENRPANPNDPVL